ncbi:MAG: hypothetical protein N3G80_01795 [Candidatus Micrarchaeota archaeon]|nr:hypothetical protein [Candidatus Micrarchaeota archaeon]
MVKGKKRRKIARKEKIKAIEETFEPPKPIQTEKVAAAETMPPIELEQKESLLQNFVEKKKAIPHAISAFLISLAITLLCGVFFFLFFSMQIEYLIIFLIPIFVGVSILSYSYLEKKEI